jgi:hypothetical protein
MKYYAILAHCFLKKNVSKDYAENDKQIKHYAENVSHVKFGIPT